MAEYPSDYCTKKDLYLFVEKMRLEYNLRLENAGIDFYEICKGLEGFDVESANLTKRTIRGIALPEDKIIILNNRRTENEKNFDCAHEFIHVTKHKNVLHKTFCHDDYVHPNQSPALEWQANEGAAELTVPHRLFIPLLCRGLSSCSSLVEFEQLKWALCEHFKVPLAVISHRIDNLKYEIEQFQNGIAIDRVEILSNSQQIRRGLHIQSYNDIFCSKNCIKKAP